MRTNETSLNADITEYLKSSSQGLVVSDTKVRMQAGRVTLTGSVRQGVLATDFTLTGHPAIVDGKLKLIVDAIEPTIVGRLSPIQPGQGIDLAANLEARSATRGRRADDRRRSSAVSAVRSRIGPPTACGVK